MNNTVKQLSQLATEEGYNKTALPGVGIYKTSESSAPEPLCYSQGIIIVVQGQKRIYFNQESYDYNPDNYLVLTLPLPAECQTIVEPGKPLLALVLDLDLSVLSELVRVLDEHDSINQANRLTVNKGLFVSQCTNALSCVVIRLSDCLNSALQCDVIGQGLIREILFHIFRLKFGFLK